MVHATPAVLCIVRGVEREFSWIWDLASRGRGLFRAPPPPTSSIVHALSFVERFTSDPASRHCPDQFVVGRLLHIQGSSIRAGVAHGHRNCPTILTRRIVHAPTRPSHESTNPPIQTHIPPSCRFHCPPRTYISAKPVPPNRSRIACPSTTNGPPLITTRSET